jgi:alpha-galactosidase
MMRVADCPGNFTAHRIGISKLRMTSGKSAVHADMLEWNPGETTEGAARNVINCLFSVIQYSMMLRDLPPEHLKMIDAWLKFTVKHRGVLLKGGFKPHFAESDYVLLEGWDDKERIFTVHSDGLAVKVPADSRTTYVINGTAAESLVVELAEKPALVEIYNTLSEKVGETEASKGLNRIKCPPSGYIVIK